LDFKSIKVQLYIQFMLFAVIILGVLWSLQIIFIRPYYQLMKTAEVKNAAAQIVSQYGREDFKTVMQQIVFQSNLVAMVTDEDGTVLDSADMTGNTEKRRPPPEVFIQVHQALEASGQNDVVITMGPPVFHSPSIVEGIVLTLSNGEKRILIVNANIEPVDSTVKILQSQLIYVTAVLILLAFLLSFIISRRISKPITRLTNSTEKLAKGDYSVHFEQGSYSEINKLSNTLNYATRQISKVDEFRKDLIANVSHDLRTPLTMIKAYAEMIRDLSGENKPKRQSHLKVIIGEADRLSALVTNLLDLSKIESGTDEVKVKSFNFSETVQCILQRYVILQEKEGYQFSVDCPEDLFATGDPNKIEQVVYNLVNNAINYTGEDKKVFVRLIEKPNKVRFEVRDTGEGIREDELENIWQRYYKVDKEHKSAVVGTGLGLSIVRSILDKHKAAYGVESKPGQGATFWFELNKNEI
jgi:signal transduction histidine kinase